MIAHGILQARILEWIAIPFSRDHPNPGIKLRSPALQADSLPAELPGYYLAIKRNAFESILMRQTNLQPITQSKVRKRKI